MTTLDRISLAQAIEQLFARNKRVVLARAAQKVTNRLQQTNQVYSAQLGRKG